ncbi:MAG TPA: ATP-binding cassette domain-containing protein, partial [Candidatus Limnocylindrales bacterium]|nr:ATP-binding cassette domain-containing protein [Candidatus Limnocylindrales bacterium]
MRGLQAEGPGGHGAVNGLDLSVPVGARLLLVTRPEATGTLLLRVLAGLARPLAGRISLAGLARSDETPMGWARRVGYVGPNPAIYPWLTPVEALMLAARLAGMDRHEAAARVEEVVEQFRLGPNAGRPMTRGGPMVAQKTALAAALVPEPEILLLDEPLRSLDPDERTRLLSLRPRRVTVVLASRYPASEAGIVGQVALLREGRLVMH